ncbi:MAG: hypothetical protein KJO59_08070 [Ignavibacteria bacterium]|nr:hypothetical protein [Ignavibacteria bacterium]
MKKSKTNIVKTVILFTYLITVISAGFYHSHAEDLNTLAVSKDLHTHIFDNTTGNNDFDAHELHKTGQDYFDEDHILQLFNLKLHISTLFFTIENSDIRKSFNSTPGISTNYENGNCVRDKYVLTETNLPPPLS